MTILDLPRGHLTTAHVNENGHAVRFDSNAWPSACYQQDTRGRYHMSLGNRETFATRNAERTSRYCIGISATATGGQVTT